LGESTPVAIDVRVLAASADSTGPGGDRAPLRADLCARLDGLTIRLPPLREAQARDRLSISAPAALTRWWRPPEVEPRLVEQLCLHDWPSTCASWTCWRAGLLVLHGHEELLRRSHLPEHILNRPVAGEPVPLPVAAVGSGAVSAASNTSESHRARRERELSLLTEALRTHKGSVARAAAAVGISRQRAYRLMEAGGIAGAADDPVPGESQ